MKKNARYTAVQALARQQDCQAYSNLLLESLCRENGLDQRDTAFASAVFYGTLERRLTLDHILKTYCSKPLEKLSGPVPHILRTGLYQLLFMDGVDDYAAVNESVSLTRMMGCDKASGFVNGVLRHFLRDGKAVPKVEGDRFHRWEVEYSCPAWLIKRWVEAYGEEASLRMLEASLGRPPVYLRANTCQISPEELVKQLTEQGVECHLEETPTGCIRVEGHLPVERLEAFKKGWFHVQDRASQLCVALLDPQPGQRALDVCAAPGGKTFTIAQRMENQGLVVARDLHQKRANLVERGAERLGLSCVKASAGDAGRPDPQLGLFDRVLCDVPCSGFGIIRRKPEIKYKSWESVQGLPEIQYKILQTSAHYLKEDGRLVYSTCTLLPEENERVVERFLKEHPDWRLEEQRTYTGQAEDSDGFFAAALRKG